MRNSSLGFPSRRKLLARALLYYAEHPLSSLLLLLLGVCIALVIAKLEGHALFFYYLLGVPLIALPFFRPLYYYAMSKQGALGSSKASLNPIALYLITCFACFMASGLVTIVLSTLIMDISIPWRRTMLITLYYLALVLVPIAFIIKSEIQERRLPSPLEGLRAKLRRAAE